MFLVYRVRRKGLAHRIFLAFLVSMTAWALSIFGFRTVNDPANAVIWERAAFALFPFISVLFFHFAVEFTRTPMPRWVLTGAYGLLGVLVVLAPTPVVLEGIKLLPYGYGPEGGPAFFLWVGVQNALVVAGLGILVYHAWKNPAKARNRTIYIILGACFSLAGLTTDYLAALGHWPYPAGIPANIVFAFFTAVALLRHDLLEVRTVLRKGLVYSAISAMLALPYLGVIVLIDYLRGRTEVSLAIAAIVLVAMGLLIQAFSDRVRRATNRLLAGGNYTYVEALQRFSREAHSISDLPALGAALVRAVSLAVQCERAELLIYSSRDRAYVPIASLQSPDPPKVQITDSSPIIRWFDSHDQPVSRAEIDVYTRFQALTREDVETMNAMDAELFVPVRDQQRLTGLLVLGAKIDSPSYTSEEIGLLTTAANQAAVVLENARLLSLERERARQFEAMNKLKSEFLLTVAHQLKTPITVVKAAVEMILDVDGQVAPSTRDRLHRGVRRGLDGLETMVRTLLELGKLQSANLKLETRSTDIRQVLSSAAAVVDPAVRARGQTLTVNLPPTPHLILADPERIEQVVLNLLTNANKYTPAGGSITLGIRDQGTTVVGYVTDSGRGIPKAEQPFVFDAYYEAKDKQLAPGSTGLGLAIAKSLMDLHGGRIWLESSEVGKGSTFCFSLPIMDEAQAVAAQANGKTLEAFSLGVSHKFE